MQETNVAQAKKLYCTLTPTTSVAHFVDVIAQISQLENEDEGGNVLTIYAESVEMLTSVVDNLILNETILTSLFSKFVEHGENHEYLWRLLMR